MSRDRTTSCAFALLFPWILKSKIISRKPQKRDYIKCAFLHFIQYTEIFFRVLVTDLRPIIIDIS